MPEPTNLKASLDEATAHLAKATEFHKEARVTHAEVRAGLSRINDCLVRAFTSHAAGHHAAVKRHLDDIAVEARLSQIKHGDTGSSHTATRRAIESAQRCVTRAIEAIPEETHDPSINPTAAMGAQTSAGREPRSYTPEEIRQRDQRRAVEAAYNRRIQEGGQR